MAGASPRPAGAVCLGAGRAAGYDCGLEEEPESSSSADSLTFFMTQYFLRRLRSPMRRGGGGRYMWILRQAHNRYGGTGRI